MKGMPQRAPQRASQPSGKCAGIQINNFPLFFVLFLGVGSHSVFNHVFFYNQDSVLSVSYFITGTNNNYP